MHTIQLCSLLLLMPRAGTPECRPPDAALLHATPWKSTRTRRCCPRRLTSFPYILLQVLTVAVAASSLQAGVKHALVDKFVKAHFPSANLTFALGGTCKFKLMKGTVAVSKVFKAIQELQKAVEVTLGLMHLRLKQLACVLPQGSLS